eukprot:CAMPEP_0184543796 /NCGR_PEP_ID=MMETSP0199_2-20130426/3178_1 /TAXON_ID=1112570 /ORGANISM="Thraustochytrium sp., Strain LLF1b" /LENGTH=343 /DNA_ID=CAMNT_0026937871 /DNA_START=55 /DNA_END=1086 /DNA_ORIENTATION=-
MRPRGTLRAVTATVLAVGIFAAQHRTAQDGVNGSDASSGEAITIISKTVSSSRDDAQSIENQMQVGGESCELGIEASICAFRFSDVEIPPEALVVAAKLTGVAHSTSSQSVPRLNITGQRTSDAPVFSESNTLEFRTRTFAVVSWEPEPFAEMAAFATPDLTPIVKEILQMYWKNFNAMVFFIETAVPSASRSIVTVEGAGTNASLYPRLEITYRIPSSAASSDAPRRLLPNTNETTGHSDQKPKTSDEPKRDHDGRKPRHHEDSSSDLVLYGVVVGALAITAAIAIMSYYLSPDDDIVDNEANHEFKDDAEIYNATIVVTPSSLIQDAKTVESPRNFKIQRT